MTVSFNPGEIGSHPASHPPSLASLGSRSAPEGTMASGFSREKLVTEGQQPPCLPCLREDAN